MDPSTLSLGEALQLLQIPRTVGTDPATGEDVVAHNGRFGPYLKRGSDTRSLTSEDQLLTVTLDEAQALFAQPKQRRGRVAAPPLRELGADPSTKLPVLVKDGRFGPYVTDGTTNASLRKGDSVEAIDIDRASELLAERRAAGPSSRKKKAAAKKAPAKKKAAAKKAPAKKKTSSTATRTAKKKATASKAGDGTKKASAGSGPTDPAMKAPSTEPF
jgi:DNA topoisomerase-1